VPLHYEIVLRGPLGPRQARVVDDFEVVSTTPEATTIVGWVADQSSLQGTLRRLADVGLDLVALRELPGP